MYNLRLLHREAVPAALEKALRYRVLNEPGDAESICLDILAVDPDNPEAIVTLLLSLSDQFGSRVGETYARAHALLDRIRNEHDRHYYRGLLAERRAKASLAGGAPGSGSVAYEWYRTAMGCYDAAMAIAPEGNDDATLRWNTCARALNTHRELAPEAPDTSAQMLE